MQETFRIPIEDHLAVSSLIVALGVTLLVLSWGLFIATCPIAIIMMISKKVIVSMKYLRIVQYSILNNALLLMCFIGTESYGRITVQQYFTTPIVVLAFILAPCIIGLPFQIMLVRKAETKDDNAQRYINGGP